MDKKLLKETNNKLRTLERDNEVLKVNLQIARKKLKEKELEFEDFIETVKRNNAKREEVLEEKNLLIDLLQKELLLKSRKLTELEMGD